MNDLPWSWDERGSRAVGVVDQAFVEAERFFTLRDILHIRERMIGTGRLGGKSVGMLLARKVLERSSERWKGNPLGSA